MRAIAWAFTFPGGMSPSAAWATTGSLVFRTSDDVDDQGWVYQWNFPTVQEAHDKCVRRAARAEANNGRLTVGPFFIDLPVEVAKEIRLGASGGRYPSPILHNALFRLLA